MSGMGRIFRAALFLTCLVSMLQGAEKMKIVCFGDSLTSCGGEGGRYSDMLQKSLPDYEIINSGKGGDTIGGGLARLEPAVLAHRAQYLVVGLGANDYWRRKRSLDDLKKDYDLLLSRCAAAGMKIVIISCFGNENSHTVSTADAVSLGSQVCYLSFKNLIFFRHSLTSCFFFMSLSKLRMYS